MKNKTINLPRFYLAFIQELINEKDYPSRSEVIRIALGEYLREDLNFHRELEQLPNDQCKAYQGGNRTMKICTLNIPDAFLEKVKILTGQEGLYPSCSELIRCAVRDFLLKKIHLQKQIREQEKPKFEDFDEKNYVRIPVENKNEDDKSSLTFKTYKILRRLA